VATILGYMRIKVDVFGCTQEQKRRYIEIKQSDLPMSVAAKRTREFRCPPQEQVSTITRYMLSHCHFIGLFVYFLREIILKIAWCLMEL